MTDTPPNLVSYDPPSTNAPWVVCHDGTHVHADAVIAVEVGPGRDQFSAHVVVATTNGERHVAGVVAIDRTAADLVDLDRTVAPDLIARRAKSEVALLARSVGMLTERQAVT